jgi:bacterioferritin-associated ferredoxin
MFICICNGVTDRQIREAGASGATSLAALQSRLGVATQCGQCAESALAVLSEQAARPADNGASLFYPAALQPA